MSKRRKSSFLEQFRLDDAYLLKPDRVTGRPGIYRARDSQSQDLLIKVWPRAKGIDDSDLEDIWRSEIRQLQRLIAVPSADDLLVNMRGSGKDSDGFYLVLDPGSGSHLETLLTASKKPRLLAQSRQTRSRKVLWANAKRLTAGLELLHSQGIIHRNLDPWAVVTTAGDEPDFLLTGFEWSMRIASTSSPKSKVRSAPRPDTQFSFSRDWRDLALLFALFLDIPTAPLGDMSVPPSRVAEHVTAAEVRLLRTMLGSEIVERLDGEYICKRIDEIIESISSEVAGVEAKLCMAVRLGLGSNVAEAIRAASGGEIEVSSEDEQIRFIRDDLGPQVQLLSVKDWSGLSRYILQGRHLSYRLGPYRNTRTTEDPTWEFALCTKADADANFQSVVGQAFIDAESLDVVRNIEAPQVFARRRGKVQHWKPYLERTDGALRSKPVTSQLHQSFALLLVVEMAYAVSDLFPVEIISKKEDAASDSYIIRIVSRRDPDREKLSELLGLEAPARRLTKVLEADEVAEDGGWTFSEPGALGDRTKSITSWRFIEAETFNSIECLKFEGSSAPGAKSFGYMAPAGMTGRITQFKRRLKALTALREHAELLAMLADPRRRIEDSQDPLDESNEAFKRLDPSKQSALKEILATVPLFLLQGPPGVGKTYLVGDVVRRRFEDDPATRILLSAQSNSAIDHLMNEVQGVFQRLAPDLKPLMVRARPADDDESAGELEIDIQAERLLNTLSNSVLTQEAPPHISQQIKRLAQAKQPRAERGVGRARISAELRAFESMLLRSANLVFATTNSAAIERLLQERSQFDWSIVEEAGKATGGELLSPLLLSHRRLMIGDHKQLPPFDIEKVERLLADPSKVKEAVWLVDDLISRYLKEPGVDEIFRSIEEEAEKLPTICSSTLEILTLFETFVERELTRQREKGGRGIARRLAEQYRMHPAIARIVSTCFYDGELATNERKRADFESGVAPVRSLDQARMPDLPVVFVDMPYSRTEGPGGRSGDRAPPWWNPDEIIAATEVLSLLQAQGSGENPVSLAVLSPYSQQVAKLQKAIDRAGDSRLPHLAGFKPGLESGQYCGTVDSFQGGEADAVVISLVRNNAHSTPAKALGFLRDNRRMNVLLSRAKWKMVLIGSLEFYRKIVSISESLPEQNIGFLKTFLGTLDAEVKQGNAAIIPFSQVKGGGKS